MKNCREVVRLVSEDLDRSLTLRERVALRFHTLICGACARYRGQVRALERLLCAAASRSFESSGGAPWRAPIEGLSDVRREAIRRLLRP